MSPDRKPTKTQANTQETEQTDRLHRAAADAIALYKDLVENGAKPGWDDILRVLGTALAEIVERDAEIDERVEALETNVMITTLAQLLTVGLKLLEGDERDEAKAWCAQVTETLGSGEGDESD